MLRDPERIRTEDLRVLSHQVIKRVSKGTSESSPVNILLNLNRGLTLRFTRFELDLIS